MNQKDSSDSVIPAKAGIQELTTGLALPEVGFRVKNVTPE